eukprot:CAMPEP_0194109978 /NCGR_PEP_ID=MMETSP0150-20130528/9339_1 /TAXON_ID=122233 /ORGANISM="Chaetoceros debilis, Strain MM31A-1" /LENGTH=330 /DNA_ID=CAMNT_0038799039 /DNA_START=87 /DNA_END=1079 /DNA_ORIENTATION=+
MRIVSLLSTLSCATAFSVAPSCSRTTQTSSTRIFAEGGPPQYDKIDAVLREAEVVGEGCVMLHMDVKDKDTVTIDYEPGHVVALEIEEVESPSDDDDDDSDSSKNSEDAKNNVGWMRGPYTVSRATADSLDILIKVVGDKSERFSNASPGTPLKFGGKFKVPILEGIQTEEVKNVVLLSTGVGVGPCIGAIEKALSEEYESNNFPPIKLIASYRKESEVAYTDHLNKLQDEHPKSFSWNSVVTSVDGRLSSSTENLEKFLNASSSETHYHLIGNGQMVSEFKEGLAKAGVSDERVTVESYFNHKAAIDNERVDRIAAHFAAKKVEQPELA